MGLTQNPVQGSQCGAESGIELSQTAGEQVGASGEFGQVRLSRVALGDGAGHLVANLTVLPCQCGLVQPLAGGTGHSGYRCDTWNLSDTGSHFIEVGKPLAGAHVGGRFYDEELCEDHVFVEVAVEQPVTLVGGGGS